MHITALHHAGLSVSDFDATCAWYADHFGFAPEAEWSAGDTRIAILAAGDVRLEIFSHPGAAPGPDETGDLRDSFARRGWKHVAFAVPDFDAAVTALEAAGLPLLAGPATAPAGYRYAFVRDPDGHHVEIVGD